MGTSKHTRKGNVFSQDAGLLPDEVVRGALRDMALDLAFDLRSGLVAGCPELREKLNSASRYLGYGLVGCSDAVYAYVRKGGLVLDIKVPAKRGDDLRRLGFQVRPRQNYQGKAGWLTGLVVPKGTDRLAVVLRLSLEALQPSEANSSTPSARNVRSRLNGAKHPPG